MNYRCYGLRSVQHLNARLSIDDALLVKDYEFSITLHYRFDFNLPIHPSGQVGTIFSANCTGVDGDVGFNYLCEGCLNLHNDGYVIAQLIELAVSKSSKRERYESFSHISPSGALLLRSYFPSLVQTFSNALKNADAAESQGYRFDEETITAPRLFYSIFGPRSGGIYFYCSEMSRLSFPHLWDPFC
jgi:hypothetical protein